MDTLADALPKEIERVQEIIKEYKTVPAGHIAAALMEADIKIAYNAMMSGDLPGMLTIYQKLKDWKL